MRKEFPVYDIAAITDSRSQDILISRFASFYDSHQSLGHTHGHNFYHILFFTSGRGVHSIDFQDFTIAPNRLYFMAPGQVHSWKFSEPAEGFIINFSENYIHKLIQTSLAAEFSFFRGKAEDSVFKISNSLSEEIRKIFERILEEHSKPRKRGTDMIILQMMRLFIEVSRLQPAEKGAVPSPQEPGYNELVLHNFTGLIESNFTKLKLPREYAELLYITPNHLNALCNDVLGKSAGEVIRDRIFLEAKRLLVHPENTIGSISKLLNFYDNSYFTKAFRKEVGMTPEEFRRKNIIQSIRV